MTAALPRAGEVISYLPYLWADEYEAGREEGLKTRPCAVVSEHSPAPGIHASLCCPSHIRRRAKTGAQIEIPAVTKLRLGLDDARSWIVLSEADRFVWPGPDIRPFDTPRGRVTAYGFLPPGFFRAVRDKFSRPRRRSQDPASDPDGVTAAASRRPAFRPATPGGCAGRLALPRRKSMQRSMTLLVPSCRSRKDRDPSARSSDALRRLPPESARFFLAILVSG